MPCHVPEYNQMFVDFCEKLTDSEKIHMCGSVVNFYYRLYLLLKYSKPANTILDYLREKIAAGKKTEGTSGVSEELRRRGITQVFLFGAGQYGRETLETLRAYGVPVEGFVDNSPEKQGTVIEGVRCFSPRETVGRAGALFIVAMMHCGEVLKQLEDYGVRHVTTSGALKKALFRVEPAEFRL